MGITHVLVGIMIALSGLLAIAATAPVPHRANQWLSLGTPVEPQVMAWLARGMGIIVFFLGLVTVLNV
jgi:hypothetical protein